MRFDASTTTDLVVADQPTHVAVLGTGNIGLRHLSLLQGLNGVLPIAVPKRAERATELVAQGYPIAYNLKEAVANGAKQCIIATDTGSHMVDSIKALELGMDILVEKPLSINANKARLLNEHATKTQRRMSVACVMRFSESLNNFREMMSQIGDIHSVHIEAQSYLPDWRPTRPYLDTYSARKGEGGVLLDLIHEIDYATWLYGWPGSVHARLGNLGRLGIEAEEFAELDWETETGSIVSIWIDYLSKPPRREMRAYGDQGTLIWDGINGTVNLQKSGQSDHLTQFNQLREDMFLSQIQTFLSQVHDHRLATGEDGVKALAICDAARLSSETRHEESVIY